MSWTIHCDLGFNGTHIHHEHHEHTDCIWHLSVWYEAFNSVNTGYVFACVGHKSKYIFAFFLITFLSVYRDHIKPAVKRWRNTTVTTTLSSWGPSDQTTCLSTANRCRDVSVRFSSSRRHWDIFTSQLYWNFLSSAFSHSQRRRGLSGVWWSVWVLPALHRWLCRYVSSTTLPIILMMHCRHTEWHKQQSQFPE